MKITNIDAREILDSRGNPTIEVDLVLNNQYSGRASVPSGASTGDHEAIELRDKNDKRYNNKGVLGAVYNVENLILPVLKGHEFDSLDDIDKKMIELDGTENKSRLGANAILGVSMAYAQAMATARNIPLYEYINEVYFDGRDKRKPSLPRPMFNIMNGGAHANWSSDIQEFMVIPTQNKDFRENLRAGSEIFHALESILKSQGMSVNVGNEGGFAPELSSNRDAFELIVHAIEDAGYTPGVDVSIGVDIAASEFFRANKKGEQDDEYILKLDKKELLVSEWIHQIQEWVNEFPIISIEDPLSQDAWVSWHTFTKNMSGKLEQVVGDDLLVTNVERIRNAIDKKVCNALLVKPNQIGTVSETLSAMRIAEEAGWRNIVSHRSGETEDTFITHLVVGTSVGQIKSGAPSRGERTSKYNELLRIEENIKNS